MLVLDHGHGLIPVSVGANAPWGNLGTAEGSRISIGNDGIIVYAKLPFPVRTEVRSLRKGALKVALYEERGHGFLLWQFAAPGRLPPICLETPFHLALNRGVMSASLPNRMESERHAVMIYVQDERDVVRVIRMVTISPRLCQEIERLCATQACDPRSSQAILQEHTRIISDVHRRFPTPTSLMRAAAIVDRAGV